MKYFLENIKNNIDFFLRKNINFSRRNYFEENESKEGLFALQKALLKEKYLIEKFNADYLTTHSTRRNYLENLYVLDLLDRFLKVAFKEDLKVLDIGCKNWFYVKGEYFFFKKYCKNLFLNGIEIDSNRLYYNFYSRAEAAKFYTKNSDGVEYIKGDLLGHEGKYDYITWFLPFVVKEPLLKWGLPISYFKPEKMLTHAYSLLADGGQMLIVNQGEYEYNVQKELCQNAGIEYILLDEIKSDFIEYGNKMYGVLISV